MIANSGNTPTGRFRGRMVQRGPMMEVRGYRVGGDVMREPCATSD